jgi:bifunctional DNase/RNase
LAKVVVTEVLDHTYYAELHLLVNGEERVISSRPSDAIALAVRSEAPIFASSELLDEVGRVPEVEPEVEAEEIIDEFKDFIESVSPDDFGA